MQKKGLWSYENTLVFILGLSFGFAFFDRNAVSYLSQYIIRDLHITYAQYGTLQSALSLSWAVSAFVIGRWSDAVGVRKPFLIGILIVFSACSVLSGLATSYTVLLVARLIMGIAEGPLMPICLAIIMVESSEHRRGLNIGVVQSVFASLLGAAIAPKVLVWLADSFNWRVAFFIAGVPGILCALAVLLWVREPQNAPVRQRQSADRPGLAPLFRERNIWICAAMACVMVSWLMLHQNFLPVFLTTLGGLSSSQMSNVMMTTGICAMIVGFLCPALSDRIGRKPVVIGACLISLLTPLAALYFHGPVFILGSLLFVGWIGTGAFALFMAVIPGETLSARYAASASGLVVCIGEIIGGSCAPPLAGWAADLTSVAAPLKIAFACAIVGSILSFFLKETASVKTGAAALRE
ncbi:MAG TPA: MFS transporter [Acidobacteriota bacterium]|nr:MFS transporter [Acidobacteriota bacterium]